MEERGCEKKVLFSQPSIIFVNNIFTALSLLMPNIQDSKISNLTSKDTKAAEDNTEKSKKTVEDDSIFSDEAKEEMIEINGTDGNDKIKASINKGKITIDVNGKKQEYTEEDAKKGFKINSGAGNDNIDISAVLGNFLIDSGDGDNKINLGKGNNMLTTGDGKNTIKAKNAKENIITTGNGDNFIDVKADKNTITTGSGNDSITVNGKDSKINSGAGNDNITTHGYSNYVNSGDGDDIIKSNAGRDEIHAGDGNDDITTDFGNVTIYGDNGDDIIKAKGANNLIYGGNDNDDITVYDENNYIEAGKGDDNITAGNGNNVIYGLDGNDYIKVGNGKNYIDGGKDDDNITTGNGNNIIFGGLGNDTINAKNSSGKIFDDNEGNINAPKMEVNTQDKNSVANLGKSVSVDGTEDFQMRVESDIESLKMLKTGQKLLSELDNSGHTVNIEQINDKNGYATPKGRGYATFIKDSGERGAGTDTTISYNPSFRGPANGVPLDVLFHEGIHAYNNATGTKQSGTYIRPEDGIKLNKSEPQAVGLPIENGKIVTHPDGTVSDSNPKGLTENAIRAELGLEERTKY